jgi:hypothetical protein
VLRDVDPEVALPGHKAGHEAGAAGCQWVWWLSAGLRPDDLVEAEVHCHAGLGHSTVSTGPVIHPNTEMVVRSVLLVERKALTCLEKDLRGVSGVHCPAV